VTRCKTTPLHLPSPHSHRSPPLASLNPAPSPPSPPPGAQPPSFTAFDKETGRFTASRKPLKVAGGVSSIAVGFELQEKGPRRRKIIVTRLKVYYRFEVPGAGRPNAQGYAGIINDRDRLVACRFYFVEKRLCKVENIVGFNRLWGFLRTGSRAGLL